MIYGSICSGIESVSVAWKPLGMKCAFMSEIDKFPCAVLRHRFPDVPLHGDFTTIQRGDYGAIDILVGGTPCQSFSVAGLRAGLADPRGNLMLGFGALAKRLAPQWLVWENVPGVLSSNGGRDFGTFLGMLAQLGYGFAYRVLDAQYIRVQSHPRAVPQRRRRVFVVGYFGDWRPAAQVLFERASLQGYPPPRREAGEGITHPASPCIGASGRGFERTGETRGQDAVIAAETPLSFKSGQGSKARSLGASSELSPTLGSAESGTQLAPALLHNMAVRRLTPRECERLQGFPDDWTLIPWRGKAAEQCPDGPRYRALGNAIAVNVMSWIGQRILMVNGGKS